VKVLLGGFDRAPVLAFELVRDPREDEFGRLQNPDGVLMQDGGLAQRILFRLLDDLMTVLPSCHDEQESGDQDSRREQRAKVIGWHASPHASEHPMPHPRNVL
jgi:hypothetical protein